MERLLISFSRQQTPDADGPRFIPFFASLKDFGWKWKDFPVSFQRTLIRAVEKLVEQYKPARTVLPSLLIG
jgi:hypothetical protein